MEGKCSGCGAILQSENIKASGYVPAKILQEGETLICQRCYRIKHYAKLEDIELQADDYWFSVKKGIEQGNVIIKVIDIMDFAGSWNDNLVGLFQEKPWILVVNKIDLLPKQIKIDQVYKWVLETLQRKKVKMPELIRLVSTEERFGVSRLKSDLEKVFGKKKIVTVVGVTNVGKSSLLNQLTGQKKLTISKFPGTTVGINSLYLETEKIKILDTPGIIPSGRISDLLCPQCNLSLIPSGEIARKTYKLDRGQALMFGGIASFKVLEEDNRPIIVAFAAQGVKFHRTKEERIEEIRKEHSGDWLTPPCVTCQKEIVKKEWKKVKIELDVEEDLAIAGLGWISVRRGPVVLQLDLPADIYWEKRKALISPKKMDNH